MSDSTSEPGIPEPNVPKPNIPKPNVPRPNTPEPQAPTTPTPHAEPPVTAPASEIKKAPAAVDPTDTFPEAPVGARIAGFAIDALVAIGLSLVVGVVSDSLGSLVALAYLLLRDCLPFLDGQSIGKKAMKTRAVTETGESLSGNWNNGLLRNVVLVIPLFAIVELIVLITRKDQPKLRRLGDEWFQTKVVTLAPTTPAMAVAPPAV